MDRQSIVYEIFCFIVRSYAGDLIGINTAIYSPSGANSGVGFAIPVDTVKDSVAEIIANGRVVRPVLGIAFAPDSSTSQLGVNGILVLSVKDGGPASKVFLLL
jgi:S1-C subfamily serine protease